MSTYTNFAIQDLAALNAYILRSLGSPLIIVEITQDQLTDCINDATEYFTKYVTFDNEYITLDVSLYTQDVGYQLPSNVSAIYALDDSSAGMQGGDVSRLFSIPNAMLNAGMLFIPHPGGAWGWASYEISMQYIELVRRMTGGGYQFEYNQRTHLLKLTPDPIREKQSGFIVVSAHIIRPETQLYGESWVKKYAMALAKIKVGTVRKKYANTQLLGGCTLDTSILDDGKAEKLELETDLASRENCAYGFFVG